MTHADLRTLLDFHYWARDRMLDAIEPLTPEQWTQDLGNSFRSVRDTVAHIYSAEWIWHARWMGESPTAPLRFEDYPDLDALRTPWRSLEAQYRAMLAAETAESVARVLDYHLLSGQPGRSTFWHMVQHVVNHGTYHRGQVTTMLRQLGTAPPKSLDLIAYYRERHPVGG